ncbi:diguanylate cyclase domain-containing protein [Anaeroselena agilis]|uniref:GGDEF domain-containing protein n=1 Tax=Anaeroselena agilis TaxID=3063788 RepID=A0ABU3NTR1_9FIRM|nr:GGDEF domain-containing protein [Selenomonadales bacterium 4137-cl]
MDINKNREILDQMFEGVYIVDKDRTILYWNAAAETLTGYPAAQVTGRRCHDNLLLHVDENGKILCEDSCPLVGALQEGRVKEAPVYLRHAQGHRVPVTVRAIPLRDDAGQVNSTMEVFTRSGSVTSIEQLKDLAQKAFLDSLTGIPNKQYIDGKLENVLSSEMPGESSGLGLLFLELANLREINDDFGMNAANTAIKVSARTIVENLPPGDLAARWYGGRFLVVSRMDTKAVLLNWANKIKALIQQSVIEKDEDIPLKVCIGGLVAKKGDNIQLVYHALESVLRTSITATANISIKADAI